MKLQFGSELGRGNHVARCLTRAVQMTGVGRPLPIVLDVETAAVARAAEHLDWIVADLSAQYTDLAADCTRRPSCGD